MSYACRDNHWLAALFCVVKRSIGPKYSTNLVLFIIMYKGGA